MMGLVTFEEETRASSPPCEDSKKAAACKPEGSPHQTPNLPAPQSWTSQPPELGEINVGCLSSQVQDILLQQLELTKTIK